MCCVWFRGSSTPPGPPLERLLKGGLTLYGYTKHRTVTVPVRGIVVGGELWPDPIGRPVIRFRRALLRHMSRANVPPPTLPALPPDLTRLVLSFLDDVRSIARVRCVSRTRRAIAGSDEVWKRFVPSHGLTACGWRLPSHPELSCFRRVEMFRRKCPHCETAANPFDGPLPFSIPPDRMLQLRESLEEQWCLELPDAAADVDEDNLCLLWPTRHGCHAWRVTRASAATGQQHGDVINRATSTEIASAMSFLTGCPAPEAASWERLPELPNVEPPTGGQIVHLVPSPAEWQVLEKEVLEAAVEAHPCLAVPRSGGLDAALQQQRRSTYLALMSSLRSSGLAFLFDARRCEPQQPPASSGGSAREFSMDASSRFAGALARLQRPYHFPLAALNLASGKLIDFEPDKSSLI